MIIADIKVHQDQSVFDQLHIVCISKKTLKPHRNS